MKISKACAIFENIDSPGFTDLELFDKQIPKKPKKGVCPKCSSRHIYAANFMKAECFSFCGDCGQALDWGDNDD